MPVCENVLQGNFSIYAIIFSHISVYIHWVIYKKCQST